jgi:hypothetical protein
MAGIGQHCGLAARSGMLRRFFGIVYLERRQIREKPPVRGGPTVCGFDREARKGDHEQS